jgi:hypothetical protein
MNENDPRNLDEALAAMEAAGKDIAEGSGFGGNVEAVLIDGAASLAGAMFSLLRMRCDAVSTTGHREVDRFMIDAAMDELRPWLITEVRDLCTDHGPNPARTLLLACIMGIALSASDHAETCENPDCGAEEDMDPATMTGIIAEHMAEVFGPEAWDDFRNGHREWAIRNGRRYGDNVRKGPALDELEALFNLTMDDAEEDDGN